MIEFQHISTVNPRYSFTVKIEKDAQEEPPSSLSGSVCSNQQSFNAATLGPYAALVDSTMPRISVTPPAARGLHQRRHSAPPRRFVALCVAEYAFTKQEINEISFNEGEILCVISKAAGAVGWWEGERCGARGTGRFPVNHVRELTLDPQATYVQVGEAFVGAAVAVGKPAQLTCSKGELIQVLEENENGWSRGRKLGCSGDQNEGWFPTSRAQPAFWLRQFFGNAAPAQAPAAPAVVAAAAAPEQAETAQPVSSPERLPGPGHRRQRSHSVSINIKHYAT